MTAEQLKKMEGQFFTFDHKRLRFFLNTTALEESAGIGWLENSQASYIACVTSIDTEGIHWSTFFLDTAINGIIPYKYIKQLL